MSETAQPRYYALISLKLADKTEKVTANVTVAPLDEIPTSSGSKPLSECTVADLQAYAAALEEEVWHTYHEITLLELSSGEDPALSLTLVDESGSSLPAEQDWREQVFLLPTETPEPEREVAEMPVTTAAKTTVDKAGETATPETSPGAPEPAPPVPVTDAPPVVETIPVADGEPRIIVAEAEAAFAEREAAVDAVTTPDGTQIAPSKARVRVAGQRRPSGLFNPAAVDIFIEEPALRRAQAHALTSLNREVAGVLVGPRPEKQPDGSYIVQIVDTIIAKHTVMQGASVTYTPESWRYMNDKLHELYPDESAVIVGWYHTHPGFGIFLSGMDLFIHQNFFTQVWHIALVLDPRAKTSGFFCWDRDKTEVSRVNFPWPHWAPGSW